MKTNSKKVNFSTGSFSENSTKGGPKFIMSSTSWLALQEFLANLKSLPSTLDELSQRMGKGAPKDMSNFKSLIDFYVKMQEEGEKFTQKTFSNIVSLSDDIYNYASDINGYYAGLKEEIQKLKANNITPNAKKNIEENIIAIVDQLAQNITKYQTNSQTVNKELLSFVSDTQDNYTELLGTGGLYEKYNNEYGTKSEEVKNFKMQLSASSAALNIDKKAYRRDVIIAATTPTYAWVFPYGLIAAAIVAGIYGHRAVEELDKIHSLEETISDDKADIIADIHLMTALDLVKKQVIDLGEETKQATIIIEKIEGNWHVITSDLNAISTKLKTDFENTVPFLLSIPFNQLISDWSTLSKLANSYRENAFITVAS